MIGRLVVPPHTTHMGFPTPPPHILWVDERTERVTGVLADPDGSLTVRGVEGEYDTVVVLGGSHRFVLAEEAEQRVAA